MFGLVADTRKGKLLHQNRLAEFEIPDAYFRASRVVYDGKKMTKDLIASMLGFSSGASVLLDLSTMTADKAQIISKVQTD